MHFELGRNYLHAVCAVLDAKVANSAKVAIEIGLWAI